MRVLLFQVRKNHKEKKIPVKDLELMMATKFNHYESLGLIGHPKCLDIKGIRLFKVVQGRKPVKISEPLGGSMVLVHYAEY